MKYVVMELSILGHLPYAALICLSTNEYGLFVLKIFLST